MSLPSHALLSAQFNSGKNIRTSKTETIHPTKKLSISLYSQKCSFSMCELCGINIL